MKNPRDPDALLAAYLADGMEVLPQRVVDSVLDEVHRTRQRVVVGPRRTRFMLKPSLAAAAVAAAVLALSGLILAVASPRPAPSTHPSQPGVVDPSPTAFAPSEEPTPSAVTDPGGVWIATGTMGTPRGGPAAVRLLDGRVLVLGGSTGSEASGDFSVLTSAELYDPLTGTWSATGNMLRQPGGFPATLLRDGKVLVGAVDDPAANDQVGGAQVYDPATGTWTATGRMVSSGGSTATLLHDGKVLVIGYDDTGELYDPDRGTWTATGRMTTPRHSHVAVLLSDGKVLVAGGHAPGDEPTDSAELYDPATGSWRAIASMHARRDAIKAFLQPDGKVLVIGSSRGDPQSAERYDPASGTWTVTGGVSVSGTSHQGATLLLDGRLLLTGDDETAELYDPVTGSWSAAAPMLRPHGTPGVLLLDGTVLVAGGNDCLEQVCVATGSAELYVPSGVAPPSLPAFPPPPPPVFPTPTPRPSQYPPAAGPVPPSARSWTVTVDNRSSEPAALFVAEEDEHGIRLVGSATPNVVPAGATVQVTFLFPAEGDPDDGWIFVNPRPGEGGSLVGAADIGIPGKILITADGQVGWLSP